MTPSAETISRVIDTALSEDIRSGDITCEAVIPLDATISMVMRARQPLIAAGLEMGLVAFSRLSPLARFEGQAEDGVRAGAGDVLVRVTGPARALLTAERTALNLIQHLSGIATLARRYADAIEGTGAALLDTRKTTPGLRELEKYAARVGGAKNHRMGLYDAVLIKDNHIALAGGIAPAVSRALIAGYGAIEVECDTLEQAAEALAAGAVHLLLDNMDLGQLRQAVALAAEADSGRVVLEASGGVTLESIRGIAETGVDFISVGRITQSAPAVDIGLDMAE